MDSRATTDSLAGSSVPVVRHPDVFARALRAAAAVTGVLRRGTAIGLAAGALAAAGCGGAKAPATPPGNTGDVDKTEQAAAPIDAAAAEPPDCADDPGWASPCCEAARDAGVNPIACTPWGPPAPPVYAGEAIA